MHGDFLPPNRIGFYLITTGGEDLPHVDSCLRLIRALAVETQEGWLEEHRYLNMDLLAEHKRELLRQPKEAA